jgi:hypothetical protein
LNSKLTLGLQQHGVNEPLKKGHRARDLFDALHAPVKKEVEDKYATHALAQKHPDLGALLSTYDKTFENWRYVFEGNYDSLARSQYEDLFDVINFFGETIGAMEPHDLP